MCDNEHTRRFYEIMGRSKSEENKLISSLSKRFEKEKARAEQKEMNFEQPKEKKQEKKINLRKLKEDEKFMYKGRESVVLMNDTEERLLVIMDYETEECQDINY